MPIVTWDGSLETGIKEIDVQHKRLFEMINNLDRKMNDPDADQVTFLSTLDGMKQYARIHFRTEEELLESCGYPRLDVHRNAHREFVSKTEDLALRSGAEDLRSLFGDSLTFLLTWIVRHIKTEDQKYVPFVRKTMKNGG